MPPQNVVILDKKKVKADDYIIISILGTLIVQLLFFKLIALMSFIVFPMFTLFLYGIYKFFLGLLKKGRKSERYNNGDIFNSIWIIYSYYYFFTT